MRWLVTLTLLVVLAAPACGRGGSQPSTSPSPSGESPTPQPGTPARGEGLIFEGASYRSTGSRPMGTLSSSDTEKLGEGEVDGDMTDVFRLRSGGKPWEVVTRSGASWLTWQPAAIDQARRDLSKRLGLPEAQVGVKEVERVEWPDACLGLPGDNEVCAQVVTPGFRIVLEARGGEHVYHSDVEGNVRRE